MSLGPISPGPCNNGTIITAGTITYSPPLRSFYFVTASTFVATTAAGQTINFGTVAAGTQLDKFAITQVGTASGTIVAGW